MYEVKENTGIRSGMSCNSYKEGRGLNGGGG